jgi:hypothetical protein
MKTFNYYKESIRRLSDEISDLSGARYIAIYERGAWEFGATTGGADRLGVHGLSTAEMHAYLIGVKNGLNYKR